MSFSHYAQASPSRTELYNGNIASMIVNVPNLGDAMAYAYKYDQLNRLTGMNAYNGLDLATNQYDLNRAGFANQMYDYQERVSYDANGNILTYFRNGTTRNGHVLGMDDLTYNYISGTNQLDHVNDKVPATNYSEDIDDQASGNYAYDQIGNLIMDNSENITDIEWTVYGKIKSITKGGGYKKKPTSFIQYRYDAAGNRICKISDIYGSLITTHTETYYVRDAQGNVMSIYEKQGTSDLYQTELNIYGSSRLGMEKVNVDVQTIVDNTTAMSGVVNNLGYSSNFVRGNKYYELSNHLGNVLATITDKKVGMSNTAGSMQVDYYVAEVSTATDYYPFGMAMPGRNGYAVSGGWANSTMKVNGQTFPADLSITSRANNTPAEYTAANSISFIGEYENGGTDEYMAYIIDPNIIPASSSPADNSSDANSNITGSSDNWYRYGFNGKEKDGDMDGNNYDYGFRIYNPGLGRFLSVDPLTKKYPELTPYQFASNRPIDGIDQDGLEYATYTIWVIDGKVTSIQHTTDYELKNKGTKGPGIEYNYINVDQESNTVNVTTKYTKNLYGIYQGSDNPQLPKIGGSPTDLHDDYELEPIDETDALAKQHDKDYDNAKISGIKGVLSDKSTEANVKYIKGAKKIDQKYTKGEKDDVTGKPVSKATKEAADFGKKWFIKAEKLKHKDENGKKVQYNYKYNDHKPKF